VTDPCTAALTGESFSQIGAAQLSQIPPGAISGFTRESFSGVNPPAPASTSMSGGCLAALPAVPGMHPDCLGTIPAGVFGAIASAQIAAFGAHAMSGLTPDQMATLGEQY